jgi:peptide/nickel transport system substrate-binding protein
MRVLALTSSLALGLGVGACDARREILHQRRDPGALVVAQASDVISLDPVRATDSESIEVGELIFEGLVGWKAGTTEIEPRLATSWQVSDDGLSWTFNLRSHVQFHDGTPFDANAVVFSFERLLVKGHPQSLGDAGHYWKSMLKDVEKVVAIDPLTVEIHTSRKYAPLLGDLAMYPMVSPAAVRKWGAKFADHPVGTGPFQFEDWIKESRVVVRRFEGYWGRPAGLNEIVFQVVVDARQRLINLESGSVDLATSILPDEQPFVELHPDLELHHAAGNDISYLAFNTQRAPFDDVRVRRAGNYAVNKEPIVKLGYQGHAIAADTPLPPQMWGYHEPATRYQYDPIAAKRLLAEAIADGKFDPARVYKLYAPSTPRPYLPQPERVARFLQASLEQAGIHTELIMQPYAEFRATVQAGQHDLCVFGWVGDTGDPDNFLYVLLHSKQSNTETGAQNVALYRDSEVDDLLLQAQEAPDEATRSAIYASVQDKVAADAPWVPIAHSELVVAGRKELEGVVLSPTGHPVYPRIRRRAEER